MKDLSSHIKSGKVGKSQYSIFNDLSEFTDDPFWKNEFKKMSNGKFPPGIIYRNNYINYRIKKKVYEMLVPDISEKTFRDIKGFIVNYSGIFSEMDMIKKEKESEKRELIETSVNIKKEAELEIYLKEFLIFTEFSEEKKKAYWYLTRLGVEYCLLGSKDFTFEKDKILEIRGIEEIPGGFQIERSKLVKTIKKPKAEIQKQNVSWNKYLKNIEKWKDSLRS